MTGLLSTINISLSAILANQRAIDVVSHNVANVNTEGYRRQGIVFNAGVPASSSQIGFGSTSSGMFGTGVLIDRIERFSTDFLDKRYRTKYHMSMIANLDQIRDQGMEAFLAQEAQKWRCPTCGGSLCCHNGLCMYCQTDDLRRNPKYRWNED